MSSSRQRRLRQFPYSGGYAYFATFCTHNRARILSRIDRGMIRLTPIGTITEQSLRSVSTWFPGTRLDEHAVMPDHVHMLLWIGDGLHVTLARVVCRIKGWTSMQARRSGHWGPSPLWQLSFHDKVVRHPAAFDRFRDYIRNNPARWASGGARASTDS